MHWCMSFFLWCEGHFPCVEIRKMNSQGLEVTSQTSTDISSDKKDVVVARDLLEISDGKIGNNQLPPELSSNMAEDSLEDWALLRLYVYGVSHLNIIR